MPTANYPLPKFHFSVEWGGTRIGFTEVTGLEMTNDVIEYREGSSPAYHTIKMPGLQRTSNIILKRGMFASDNDFYTWYNTIAENTVIRRDITINLLDESLAPVIAWKVRNAWPFKIVYTDLKAGASEVAIETLELTHEGLTIQNN
jgi:phage tail-like protein